MDIFNQIESIVRSYCWSFSAVFVTAKGSLLTDTNNQPGIAFLSCGGAFNYGYNDSYLKMLFVTNWLMME